MTTSSSMFNNNEVPPVKPPKPSWASEIRSTPVKPRRPSIGIIQEEEVPPPKPPKPDYFKTPEPVLDDHSRTKSIRSHPVVSTILKISRGRTTGKDVRAHTSGLSSEGVPWITIPGAREEETAENFPEKFMAYLVQVQLPSGSFVRTHRYQDFAEFHKLWTHEYSTIRIDLPKRIYKPSDDEIAKRCVELQTYLRKLVEVKALHYYIAKFLDVTESELKEALDFNRSKIQSPDSSQDTFAVPQYYHRPKVNLDGSASSLNTEQKEEEDDSFTSSVRSFFSSGSAKFSSISEMFVTTEDQSPPVSVEIPKRISLIKSKKSQTPPSPSVIESVLSATVNPIFLAEREIFEQQREANAKKNNQESTPAVSTSTLKQQFENSSKPGSSVNQKNTSKPTTGNSFIDNNKVSKPNSQEKSDKKPIASTSNSDKKGTVGKLDKDQIFSPKSITSSSSYKTESKIANIVKQAEVTKVKEDSTVSNKHMSLTVRERMAAFEKKS